MRGRWRRAARVLGFVTGGLAIGLLGLLLALPVLVDQPRIRVELEERLSALVHGTVAWDSLQLHLLPAPRGVIAQARMEIPGMLTARAGRLEASLRLWPLLRGRVDVASLTAVDPQIRLELTPPPGTAPTTAAGKTLDPIAAYRSAAAAAAHVLSALAPDTRMAIEGGSLDLRVAGIPPLELRALEVSARSAGSRADLQLACSSPQWRRLSLAVNLAYADLSARADLQVEELNPEAWVKEVMQATGVRLAMGPLGVRANLQTDGANAVAGQVEASTRSILLTQAAREFDVPGVAMRATLRTDSQRARIQLNELLVDGEKLLEGDLEYAYPGNEASGRVAFDFDAVRALGLARRILAKSEPGGLQDVESAQGRLRGSAHFAHRAGRWRAGLQIRNSDVAVRLRQLPWPIVLRAGSAEWEPGALSAGAIQGSLGRSTVADFNARLRLEKELRVESAAGKANLDLDELYPWLRQQSALVKVLHDVPAASGTVAVELVKASGRLSAPVYEVRAAPRDVRIRVEALPGPLLVAGGTARITPSGAFIQGLSLGFLDAKVTVSATATGIGSRDFQVQAKLAEGSAGPEAVGWSLARAKAPSLLALRAPFTFAAEQLDWGPGPRLAARASIRFDSETNVAAEVAWEPGTTDLRRLEVQDARGGGALSLRAQGRQIEGRFNGSMHGAVLAYFLKDSERFSGNIAGDLRFAADLDRLRQASIEGQLSGEGVDLSWLAGRSLKIERFAIEAERSVVRIGEVVVKSGEDSATLRGELRRGERGPIVDASIESAGVVLDRLIAPAARSQPPVADAPAGKATAGQRKEPRDKSSAALEFKDWWPLPVTGRIGLHAGFVQYGQYRVAPVALALNLEPDRARLEVEQAKLCGIDLPFFVEARNGAWTAAARLAAMKQPVAQMAACLTGDRVQITGDAEFVVALKTQGGAGELLRNLEGTGRAEVRDGRIQKFALIGNVLSLLDIQDLPQTAQEAASGAQGFRFRKILAAGRFSGGQFTLDEGAFESPAAGMAAKGTIRLSDYDTKMTVLVAPFGRVDRLVRGIPVIGYVIGGTLTSIPVGVSGDIRSPLVVPLGPRAITSELLGIFQRTMKVPGKLAEPPVKQ